MRPRGCLRSEGGADGRRAPPGDSCNRRAVVQGGRFFVGGPPRPGYKRGTPFGPILLPSGRPPMKPLLLLTLACLAAGPGFAQAGGQRKPNIWSSSGRRPSATPTSAFRAARTSRRRTSTRWPSRGVRFTNGYVSGPVLQPDPRRPADRPLPDALRPRVQPRRRRGRTIGPAAHRDDLADASRRPATPPAWSASGTSAAAPKYPPAAARLRRVLRLPRRRPRLLPRQGAPTFCRGTDGRRGEGIPDRRLRPRGRRLHRPAQGAAVLPLPGLQRRPHADARDRRAGSQKFASIKDKQRRTYAAMLLGAWTRPSASVLDEAARGRAGGGHADLLLQRQRRPDDAGHHHQRLAQRRRCAAPSGPPWRAASACRSSLPWKGTLPGGQDLRSPVIQLDILPTALAAAGRRGRGRRGSSTASTCCRT